MTGFFRDPITAAGAVQFLDPVLHFQRIQMGGTGISVRLNQIEDRISGNLVRFCVDLDAVCCGVLCTLSARVMGLSPFMVRVGAGAEVTASPRLANLRYVKYAKVN